MIGTGSQRFPQPQVAVRVIAGDDHQRVRPVHPAHAGRAVTKADVAWMARIFVASTRSDTSGSMSGSPIEELNAGLVAFKDELMADSMAAKP